MHMVLLEMHTAPQKQCETILLVQSVFLKMSERKHLKMKKNGHIGLENI